MENNFKTALVPDLEAPESKIQSNMSFSPERESIWTIHSNGGKGQILENPCSTLNHNNSHFTKQQTTAGGYPSLPTRKYSDPQQRMLSQWGQMRFSTASPSVLQSLSNNESYTTPTKSNNISPTSKQVASSSVMLSDDLVPDDSQIARNVTEEDDEDIGGVEKGSQASRLKLSPLSSSPSTPASSPGSLEGESTVVHSPLLRFVHGREDCVNPVSRILWERTTMDEEDGTTASSSTPSTTTNRTTNSAPGDELSSSPFSCFRVVSPLSLDGSKRNSSSATSLARPMAVRPMLLA